jgi:hypothetical protein
MTQPIATEETLMHHVRTGINQMASADWIARYLEAKHKRKPGSMHLAVKLCMRRLEAKGLIVVLGPKDQWDTYTLCIPHDQKAQKAD